MPDAITYFLTYPHSNFDVVEYNSFLSSIKPVIWSRVARERHGDGDYHMHAIVKFGTRVKTNAANTTFDFLGRHPNIQVPRRVKDVLEYVSKDGDFVDTGPVPTAKNVHQELVTAAQSGDRDELDKCAMENRVSFQWADHIWKRHATCCGDVLEPGEGTECVQLQGLSFCGKSTVVIGPSGAGKSTWAKRVCPKPALWCTHLDDLKKLNKSHKCIIFDDMDFQHLPRSTQIYLVDQDDTRTIHCRHTNAIIPKGMPKIFTANNNIFIDDEAINRRVIRVRLQTWTV